METRSKATRTVPVVASRLQKMSTSLTVVFLILVYSVHPDATAATNDSSIFRYTRGPVPDTFQVGEHYPARSEMEECRPIRLRIGRDSRLFRTKLVVNNNPDIHFASNDAKRMTSRLQSRLNSLATTFYSRYRLRFAVHLAWVEYSADDGVDDPQSLHYEGELIIIYSSIFIQF